MTIIPLDQCLSTEVKSTAQLQANGCFTLIFVYICMFILRFTDSDYSFGILKLFFLYTYMYHPGVAEFRQCNIFPQVFLLRLNSIRREIVSYVTIVFYDKVGGQNKVQR